MLGRIFFGESKELPKPCLQRWAAPVVNLGRSEIRHCCRTPAEKLNSEELREKGPQYFSNSSYILKKRAEMLRGERDPDCHSCLNLEDKGIVSPRSDVRDYLNYATDQTWQNKFSSIEKAVKAFRRDPKAALSRYPTMLEISLHSICNMKCIYCSHHYSTLWAKERFEFGDITKEEVQATTHGKDPDFEKHFWTWFEETAIQTLDQIQILGGEPFLTPAFYEFSERLIGAFEKHRKTSKPLTIGIVTNLNLNDQQMDKMLEFLPRLAKFVRLDLNVSMESVGRKAEYIRHGIDFPLWEHNLDRLLAARIPRATVSMQMALNCLNISSIHDFVRLAYSKWKRFEHPIYLRRNAVSDPAVHSFMNLPADFARYAGEAAKFLESVQNDMKSFETDVGGWAAYARYMRDIERSLAKNQPTDEQKRNFYRWFVTNDQRRKSNLLEVFPELADFWKDCERSHLQHHEQLHCHGKSTNFIPS